MYSLRKIKELKAYRFFNDFKWDENACKLFAQNNLIYGWNGSGKTTLCDFFKDLERGQLSYADTTFSLMFQNADSLPLSTINQSRIGSIPYRFKVFDQNYIQENISVDAVRHIFSVGREQAEKIEEVKRLRKDAADQEALVKRLSNEYSAKEQEFEHLKTGNAKIIKDAANYTNAYNKNRYYASHKGLKDKQILTDEDYQKAIASIRAESRPEIPLFKVSFIQSSVKEYVNGILCQTPVNNTIEALQRDSDLRRWIETGLSLHENSDNNICRFCGNVISTSRMDELRNHFNKSYKELSEKIDGAVKLLREKHSQFDSAQHSFPNYALLYPELQGPYRNRCKTANEICNQYKTAILGIIDILLRKKSDMINDAYVSEFDSLVGQLSFDYSAFEEVIASLEEHNRKTRGFQKNISETKALVEKHHVSVFFDEMVLFENALANAYQQVKDETQRLNSLKTTIALMEQEIKNSQIPADSINRDIAFIMGRSELVFTNLDLGYRITRNGVRAKHLSKGEENAIALIYFFNTLLDVEADAGNSIIVLDDPISSFDSNFYYNAISYIREKTSQAGQTFIFTHKFSLMKDFSLMFNDNNTNHYTIQRIANTPRITNEDALIGQYHDEYAYLFKKIYFFVKTPPNDIGEYLQYPNIARRLLEGFLTFKIPSNKPMIDKVLTLEAGRNSAAGRAILRLLNNHSHLRVISGSGLADDIDSISVLPDILKHLLDFMKLHDEQHYNTLAQLSDPQYNSDGGSVDVVRVHKRRIKLFDMPASAGLGNFLDDNPDAAEIEVTNEECTFGVRISGDSMVPTIEDGDIVLVKQCDAIPNARIGVVWYKGKCYCKKVVQTPAGTLLVSVNRQYSAIPVTEPEELHVFGEVVDTIKP